MKFLYRLEITINNKVFYTRYMDNSRLEAFTKKFDSYVTCVTTIRKDNYIEKVLP